MSDRLTIAEIIRKGEKLNLPVMVTTKSFIEANLIEVSQVTLTNWCKVGKFPTAKKLGKYWYIDWKKFIQWFFDVGEPAILNSRWHR